MHISRPDDMAVFIRDWRIAAGWSQQNLADRMGVSRKWVNEVEQDGGVAKLGFVLRALKELDVQLMVGPMGRPGPEKMGLSGKAAGTTIDDLADMGLTDE